MRTRLSILLVFAVVLAFVPLGPAAANGTVPSVFEDLTLTENHLGGMFVKDNNITLDCDGYSIIESETVPSEGVGIGIEGLTGVTVRNCNIVGFDTGIDVSNASENVIRNNVIKESHVGVGVGNGSHDNLFIDNEVLDSTAGFYVVDGHHNEFKDDYASGNEMGFAFRFSSQNTLKGNTASGNSQDGFLICDSSTENILKDNNAFGNGTPELHGSAFHICDGSDNNVLKGNVAEYNESGFMVNQANANSLTGNTARYQNEGGFLVVSGAQYNVFTGNASEFNDDAGFLIVGDASHNTIKGNSIVGNKDKGVMAAFGSADNLIAENRIRDNSVGFWAWADSPDNIVRENSFCHNGEPWANAPDSPTVYIDNKVCGKWTPPLFFAPVQWTIEPDAAGESFHTIFMIADVSTLAVDDVQDLGGSLVWDETEVTLCSDLGTNTWISIRGVGDGYLQIGDGFQSNDMGGDCSINAEMQNAFDDFGLPQAACLFVRAGDRDNEYCARLDVLGDFPLLLPAWPTDEDVYEAGYVLAEALSEATGETFFGVPVESPREMYDLMCAMPETAVGFMPTLIYSFAGVDCGVDASFKAVRFGLDHSQTQFVVPSASTATGIGDLDGLTWAYSDRWSLTSYIVPLGMMNANEPDPVIPGGELEAGSHIGAAEAVSSGVAGFATTFVSPTLPGDVKVLVTSEEIPNDPVAFGADFPTALRLDIEAALAALVATPSPNVFDNTIGVLYDWVDISPATDADWDWLRSILAEAGFNIDDL